MAGKKKNMEGGIFGLVPYQPKYDAKTVTNETFNELYKKLKRSESNLIRDNSSFLNKVLAKKNIFLNTQRSEQRLIHFLEILNHKLSQPNITVDIFLKLYNYFKDIYNKYKDTQGISVRLLLKETKNELDRLIKPFIDSKQLIYKKNQVTIPEPQNPSLRMNNKKQKLEEYKNNQVTIPYQKSPNLRINNKKQKLEEYKNLIEEFNDWYGIKFFKNFREKRTINIQVEQKDGLFSYIIDLANRIYGLGKHYSLPEYKDDEKLIILRDKLGILKELYKAVFIKNLKINKVQEYAKNYENHNINLNKKYKNLIGN
jgi:hypothetical protein